MNTFKGLCVFLVGFIVLTSGCSLFVEPPEELDTNFSEDEIDAVIAEGMEAWRKQGATMGGAACANCHSPDALDLAYFDFDKQTIKRRAKVHVDGGENRLTHVDVNKIIRLVEAQRQKYDITPKDHMNFRPLQPGGEVLSGSTPAEREQNFAANLVEQGYRFANVPVLSEEEALKQRDEWLKLNPRNIKIGIPLNRWSEDPHHGSNHSTMADWLPDLPRVPQNGKADKWYELQDKYIQNPTDEHFWEMFRFVRSFTEPIEENNSNRFFSEKYESVLFAQHIFRKEIMEGKALSNYPSTVLLSNEDNADNPIWDVGAIAHVLRNGDLRDEPFQLPAKVKSENGDVVEEMNRIRVPWFFAGWLLDQGLQHSGEGEITESGRYFTMHMHIDDSYPIHNIYMITRKMVVENYDAETQDLNKPLTVNYSNFSNRNYAIDYEPKGQQSKKLYRLITENSYRMMLLLIKKEVREKGIPTDNQEVLDNWLKTIEDFKDFAEHAQTEHYQYNLGLIAEVKALI